jgi:peptidyl-prolyl cis-trans isomerase D
MRTGPYSSPNSAGSAATIGRRGPAFIWNKAAMLQAIRGQAASWIVKALFVVLILSFVAWGVADYVSRSHAPTSVATVGTIEISPSQLSNAVNQESQRLRQIFGSLEREQLKQLGIIDQVLNRLIGQTLVELEARRLGVTIDDEVLRGAIQGNPAFRNEQGQFDRNRFQIVLNQAGFTEASFLGLLRQDLLRSQLMTAVASGSHPPDVLVSALVKRRGERRVADTVSVPLPGIETVKAPTEEQLVQYHTEHAADFTAPEYRDLSWVRLAADDLAQGMQPGEQQIKDAYEQRIDEFRKPETREVEQILLTDETAAKAASDKLVKGEAFDKVAAESGTSSEQLALGSVRKDELPPDLADVIFGAEINKPTQPVKSDFGWHIFRVTSASPESQRSLEEVHDELAKTLAHEKAADAIYEQANKLEDLVSAGTSLEDSAQRLALKVEKADGVDAEAKKADGSSVTLPNSEQLRRVAFGLSEGQTSSLIESKSGDEYIVVRADHVTAPALKPIDQVKNQVESAWINDQRDQAAKARADALADKAKSGTSLADVAKSEKLNLETTAAFTRDGDGLGTLPQALAAGLFAAKAPGEVTVAQAGAAGYIVASLKEVKPVSAEDEKALAAQVNQQAKGSLQGDLSAAFQNALRGRYDVSIDRKALDNF